MKVKKILKYFGISVAILIGVVVVSGQIAHYNLPVIDPPGKIFLVNGTKMHLYCTGPENEEQPTIIIINGASIVSPTYYPLQERLSKNVRTCSYDHAGVGWSEPNNVPANAKNMSNELFQLLYAAKIEGPVFLVGHSLGGIVGLIYSAEHEDQVAGIAFIDSSHYNQFDYFGKDYSDKIYNQMGWAETSFGGMEILSSLGILNLIGIISGSSQPIDDNLQITNNYYFILDSPFLSMKSEIVNLELSLSQGKEAFYPRGDLPIISLSASDIDFTNLPQTELSEKEMKDVFRSFHKELADLSTNGKHVIVDETDHMSIIQNENTAEQILNLILKK